MGLIVFLTPFCYGATIAGTVKGPNGASYQGVFVEAQNTKTRITVIVLSNSPRKYPIEHLPAGDYRVRIRAVGYRVDRQNTVNLSAAQNASLDSTLQNGVVR